jgi:hypothetical protein
VSPALLRSIFSVLFDLVVVVIRSAFLFQMESYMFIKVCLLLFAIFENAAKIASAW